MNLTADYLRSILHYDEETGIWTWRISPSSSRNVGDIAGHIDNHGYRRISIKNKQYRAHRLAWLYVTGSWPTTSLDHKNLDRSDNAWANLRLASRAENCSNTRSYRNNKCGLKGVHKRKNGRFLASIQSNGNKRHIGLYDTADEAHAAYCLVAKSLHGEFGRGA